ncbi:cell wall-binding repeat-containing protein [Salinibacterium sp. NG253]|uniref:cell wall-binding repeat-containing protein n=1 Tax=Salinibacterium sp. NG253 TaxID=2792039 RepID=UPI0018CE7A10|nr:cell wall-binding repeat-containing protein [Salinibacterium sp. NG253]MBH0117532.1 cell wall-binding repeat-containing protein [Salinibacterium sp. NG253]
MSSAYFTSPKNRLKVTLAALFAAIALVVAPVTSAAPASAIGFAISGSWSAPGATGTIAYLEAYDTSTYDTVEITITGSTFKTEVLAAGEYTIFGAHDDSRFAGYSATVEVSASDVTHDIEFLKNAYIRGSVTDFNNVGDSGDKSGGPSAISRTVLVSVENVDVSKNGTTHWVSLVDDKPSTYEIPIAPGTYTVGFSSSAYSETQYFPGTEDASSATEITLAPGEKISYVDAIFPVSSNEALRLGGSNRYATSVKITQRFAPGVERLYIATGDGFADGLSAVPAAAAFDSPLLLTETGSLPSVVAAEVERLDPEQIVVVGGTGVVSAHVVTQLNALVADDEPVMRLEGSNRYATSRAIARDAFPDGADVAFIATGANFPDALAASPAAAYLDGPVILVNGDSNTLDAATQDLLVELGVSHIKIAGGTGVVSSGIEAALATVPGVTEVIRYSGGGRVATAVAINQLFPASSTAFVATSTGFADSLGGAALAGFKDAPLYLSPAFGLPCDVLDDFFRLGATSRVVLGGEGVLSHRILTDDAC